MTKPDLQQRVLLNFIADYWLGYGSADEAETPYPRRWSSQSLTREIVKRALSLVDAFAAGEDGSNTSIRPFFRERNIIRLEGHRIWKGLRLTLFGLDNADDTFPASFQSQVRDAAANSLPLCLLPSSYIEMWQDFASELRSHHRFVLPLFPADLNALARGQWSLLDLVEYKLYRILLLDKLDNESQYADLTFSEFSKATIRRSVPLFSNLNATIEKIDDSPSNWVEHPLLNRLVGLLREGRDCILVGPSSSGKSVLAFEAGLRLASGGSRVEFTDVGSVSPQIAARVLSNLKSLHQANQNTLLIIDDLQSSPSVVRYLFTVKKILDIAGSTGKITILAVTWPSYAQEALEELAGALEIKVKPADAQHALLSRYGSGRTAADIAAMSEIAEGDVLLWRLLLEHPREKNLTKAALAQEIWTKWNKSYRGDITALKRTTLIAALLGRYEFELSEGFLEYQAGVTKSTITAIVRAKILRRSGNKLVLGHRSVCAIIADWLSAEDEVWAYLLQAGKPANPVDIVHSYIRTANATDIWAILKTLHSHVGFRGGPAISLKALVLADAWKSIDALIERIEQQQTLDPTWGKTLSSILFAIEALCAVGKADRAKASIEFMRSHWSLINGHFEILEGTAERLDFDRIQASMKEEDDIIAATNPVYETAEQVDLDRFHHIWVLGLILCAEEAYRERSDEELRQLALAVEQYQEPEGYFYPRRVPWCTARVLMGLARCGRSYTNSEAVKKACDWLLRSVREGGVYQDGVWESGTGVWNTPLEVTSMCIIALNLAGIPTRDSRLVSAWNYIASEKAQWTRPEREIDGANAIVAYLAVVGNWQGVTPEIQYLLKWSRQEAFWDSATKTANELFDQSCKVAVIADYLIDAVWSSLRSDLPEFLEMFAVPSLMEVIPGSETTAAKPAIQPSPVDQLRSLTISKIQLEYEDFVGRLRDQSRELIAYETKLRREEGSHIQFDELGARRKAVSDAIVDVTSKRDITIAALQQATTEQVLETVYRDWHNAVED